MVCSNSLCLCLFIFLCLSLSLPISTSQSLSVSLTLFLSYCLSVSLSLSPPPQNGHKLCTHVSMCKTVLVLSRHMNTYNPSLIINIDWTVVQSNILEESDL
eukprot:scpid112041/ scgid33196/ 